MKPKEVEIKVNLINTSNDYEIRCNSMSTPFIEYGGMPSVE